MIEFNNANLSSNHKLRLMLRDENIQFKLVLQYLKLQLFFAFLFQILIGLCQVKKCLQTCTKCADSVHPVHEQSHPGICCLFIHSVVHNGPVSGQWKPWQDCADVQADLGLHCLDLFEDVFTWSHPIVPSQENQSNTICKQWKSILSLHSQGLVTFGYSTELR